MTVSTKGWAAIFLGVVFVSGGFAGVAADRFWLMFAGRAGVESVRGGPPPSPGIIADANVSRLDRGLGFTDIQRGQVRAILVGAYPRLQRLQDTVEQLYGEEQAALHLEINSVLTADQRTRFATMSIAIPALGQGGAGRGFGPGGGRASGGGRGPGRGFDQGPAPGGGSGSGAGRGFGQ